MVVTHIAYGLDLISLTLGSALLVWSMKNPGKGSWIGKLFGLIVMLLSIASLVCMFSCTLRGGECHDGRGYSEGVMAAPMSAPEEVKATAHEHAKKVEHKK